MAVPVNSATSGVGYGVQNGVRFCAHRHARGHRNSPPDCCYPGGLPCSSLAQRYYEQKSTRRNALCFLLERITRLARCVSARTGTHAGTATVPRTVATLAGCPVRVSHKDTTNKKAQGEMPCAFCWSGLRDSPGAFLRAPARTRAPQQSPGLLLPWRVALFESRTKILRTKKHKAKCLVLFVGADYETRTRYLHLGKVALYQMS